MPNVIQELIEAYMTAAQLADRQADEFGDKQFLVCEGAMREVATLYRRIVSQLREKKERAI